MRVRMLKPSEGILDGVSLAHLIPGLTYDLDASVANHLITSESAEELPLSAPALVIPLDNARAFVQLTRGVTVVQPRAEAAEKPPRLRRRRKSAASNR
jgi:hypothetical protein